MEWQWLEREHHLLDRVGQLIVTLHTFDLSRISYEKKRATSHFLEIVEKSGLRLYHKEYDLETRQDVDLSFIKKDWSEWNSQKKYKMPDLPAVSFLSFDNKGHVDTSSTGTSSNTKKTSTITVAGNNISAVKWRIGHNLTSPIEKYVAVIQSSRAAMEESNPSSSPSKRSKKSRGSITVENSNRLSSIDNSETPHQSVHAPEERSKKKTAKKTVDTVDLRRRRRSLRRKSAH